MRVSEVRDQDTGRVALHEIDNAARCAAQRCWSQMLPMDERVILAWEAIAEAITAAEQRLRFNEMVQAGIEAIDLEARDWLRHNGRSNSRSFDLFWLDWIQVEGLFEAQVCERVALEQVMRVVPDRMRRALIALTVAGDLEGAAHHLGQHYDTVARNVREARALIYALWFGDESAPTIRRDRRVSAYATKDERYCAKGHELTPENTYRIGVSGRCCRDCQIERSARRRAEQKARKRSEVSRDVAARADRGVKRRSA